MRVSILSYLDGPEENWIDERRHTHTDRPAGDTESVALCTHLTRKDLSWQQESDSAPGGRIYQIEHEQHGHCRRRECRCPGLVSTGYFVERRCLHILSCTERPSQTIVGEVYSR